MTPETGAQKDMYDKLPENCTGSQILRNGLVRANLRDFFSLKTFGLLQYMPRFTSRVSLENFLHKGMKKNIVYGINGTVEKANRGLFTLHSVDGGDKKIAMLACGAGKRAPTAIICPGGAYATCATIIEGLPIAARLNELGFNAVVVEYSTGRRACALRPLADVAAAIEYIRSCPGLRDFDVDNYSIFGFSAGGHLAGCLANKDVCRRFGLTQPRMVALGYPVVSFEKWAHRLSRSLFLGRGDNDVNRHIWSLDNLVDADYAPVFMFHCKSDSVVPIENSRLLRDKLRSSRIAHEYVEYERGEHGYGLALDTVAEGWLDRAAAFWQRQLPRRVAMASAENNNEHICMSKGESYV